MQTKLWGSNPCGNADTNIRSYLLNIEDSVFHTAENNQSLLHVKYNPFPNFKLGKFSPIAFDKIPL